MLATNTSQLAQRLAQDSARSQLKGRSNVYDPALLGRELYTPEEVRKFVGAFQGWTEFNSSAADKFLGRSASEFATRIEDYVGDNIDYKKIDEAMTKYGLSVEDLIQLKRNLTWMRQNNDGNLKISMMLPILMDEKLTSKILKKHLFAITQSAKRQ